jgi:biopolymer transport protein ExbD
MIDVTLLLLFFFMLSGRLSQGARLRSITLPQIITETGADAAGELEVLNVDVGGTLFIGERAVEPRELATHLRSRFQQRASFKLHLRADAATPAAKVKEILRMASEAGALEVVYGIRR